jgi:hypothetical protein
MFHNLVQALLIVVVLYVGILFLKSYKPQWFGEGRPEGFSGPGSGPRPAAAPKEIEKAIEPPPRVVAAGGPAAPSAESPAAPLRRVPDEVASDPYDEVQGKVPIEDNLRHPENSFSPGILNTGTGIADIAGIASRETTAAMQTFSPEFAQNGGEFMPGILPATDGGDEYALV